jgi:hypothetical protein
VSPYPFHARLLLLMPTLTLPLRQCKYWAPIVLLTNIERMATLTYVYDFSVSQLLFMSDVHTAWNIWWRLYGMRACGDTGTGWLASQRNDQTCRFGMCHPQEREPAGSHQISRERVPETEVFSPCRDNLYAFISLTTSRV